MKVTLHQPRKKPRFKFLLNTPAAETMRVGALKRRIAQVRGELHTCEVVAVVGFVAFAALVGSAEKPSLVLLAGTTEQRATVIPPPA